MEENKKRPDLTGKKEALAKAEHFCAYQERSQQEVRDKLYSMGLRTNDVEELISELIGNNFINEERFAFAYARGKFRMKSWGRLKIYRGLRLKKVPEKLILKAMASIDEKEYYSALQLLVEKKAVLLNEKNPLQRRYKLLNYACSKGFEKELVLELLNDNQLAW